MRRAMVGLVSVFAMPIAMLSAYPFEAGALQAQDTSWLAWIGCWEGASPAGEEGDQPDTFIVCFQPAASEAGVEILTYTDGELVSLEEMIADGTPRPVQEDGCRGEREARWSEDGARVFMHSTLSCGEGVTRATRGVLSILPGRDGWAEIQSVQAGDESPVVGIRTFVSADETSLAELGVPDPADGRELAVRTARIQASRSLTPEGLVETVEQAGADATGALLVERGERFGLDAETLRALDDSGVPGEVLDVMVAMSYPERFEVSGGPGAEPEIRTADATAAERRTWSRSRSFPGYSPWGYGLYWDPFWYGRYGFGFGYGRFGYDSFGLGPYGFGYYGYPRVVVIEQPTVRSRATLSRERGVVPPDDGQSGATSRTPSRSVRPDRSRGTSRARPQSSSPRVSSGSSSGSGSGSGNVRRARPRD